jgi:Sulfotransferase domain
MLPNFIVIGAAKAGSTSLWQYLRSHPQIYMAEEKEPEFFLESGNWARGRRWYESRFARAGDAVAVGEASVRYTTHPFRPGAAERIAALLPDVRLIYLVRDPVSRMVSQWLHNLRRYAERDPLFAAVRTPRYLLPSSYAYQAERFLRHFPQDRLVIVQTERLRTDQGPTLDRIFAFLGVEPGHRGPALTREFNPNEGVTIPRPVMRRALGVRGMHDLQHAIPLELRRRLRPVTRVPPRAPDLPAALVRELHERLRDDVARLRAYAEPSFDGWGIA